MYIFVPKLKKMKSYIKDILTQKGMTQQDLADLLGVSRPSVSATISRPSFPTLERIAAALDVEPWQLLAPPAVVEEVKQARAQRAGGVGGALVGVVRVGGETYTADTVQQLRAIVERLEQGGGAKR
jgi:transcriptional regulator with XRE-family HTH domain|nr:helix-turn-helix transcriptional regulator [uncultured Prevotella sp.]DAK82399.1 MAG TPA: helix-turn-helix domain protein [Caudoviricetes sp.]